MLLFVLCLVSSPLTRKNSSKLSDLRFGSDLMKMLLKVGEKTPMATPTEEFPFSVNRKISSILSSGLWVVPLSDDLMC